MIYILDDVLSAEDRAASLAYFANRTAPAIHWSTKSEYWQSILLNKARSVIDLTAMIGFECWLNNNTKPNWHVDKDEGLQELVLPLCSIVYYPLIENLVGGRFSTYTEDIVPKTNRMIVFSPGIYHGIEDWTGTRISIALNPWNRKPVSYDN